MIQDAQNHVHCSKCYKVAECNSVTDCKIVTCSNRQCGARMHECKLDEHLNEICWYQFTECINKCNGCKLKIKRIDMSQHLKCCCASVIRCSSFRLRNLWNKNEKFQKLKWPCPIQLEYERNSKSIVDSTNVSKPQNMSDILLKQDYESIRKLAADSPLIFHRLYGYLIGLDVSSDFSRGRFSFLRKILKNVKSKIFPDIEAENCVILNDETGCLACQYRIRHLERKRFRETRTFENRIKFYSVLGELDDYATFVEEKIYEKPAFIKIYSNVFLAEKETKETVHHELPSFSKAEIDSKLLENNREILQVLELNPVLKVNITKEMACESFIEYESYRLKETTYTSHCDLFLRRDAASWAVLYSSAPVEGKSLARQKDRAKAELAEGCTPLPTAPCVEAIEAYVAHNKGNYLNLGPRLQMANHDPKDISGCVILYPGLVCTASCGASCHLKSTVMTLTKDNFTPECNDNAQSQPEMWVPKSPAAELLQNVATSLSAIFS